MYFEKHTNINRETWGVCCVCVCVYVVETNTSIAQEHLCCSNPLELIFVVCLSVCVCATTMLGFCVPNSVSLIYPRDYDK